jgi:8-amino-7-oxononanoate synthase
VKQGTPPALRFLEEAIADAKQKDLFRERLPLVRPSRPSFCSNDYLALADRPAPREACGAGASRLVVGEREVHRRLEQAAARLVGQPASLVFTSGYVANLGLLGALAGPEDLIVSDALNHASLIDGARLSRARVAVVPHLDVDAVARALETKARNAFVVTESYFSMDADSPDLAVLRRLCDARGAALIVDEAHALGVLGPNGTGVCVEQGVAADAVIGTFGKAFGAAGAFVAGCASLIAWLWNRARTFVFSTGMSPVVAAAALEGIERAEGEPWRRQRVLQAALELRGGLAALGLDVRGFGHVIPWVLGDARDALAVSHGLREHGIDVPAIRPPSVPWGTSRLRFAVSADHQTKDIQRALEAVAAVIDGRGPPLRTTRENSQGDGTAGE